MKKVLILGASVLQVPAIKKAKENGYDVGVVDYNPRAVGVALADEYFNVSTIDADGVIKVAKDFKPNGIMTLATDMPMRSIAAATEACGLPGVSMDTAVKSTDKGEMIRAFEIHGVAHPNFHLVYNQTELETVKEEIAFPCIMKPTDNSGSRGVVLCHDWQELMHAYGYAEKESRGGTVIIEEYMVGPEVSVEIVVINGAVHILQVTDKLTTGAPHFVEMGHSQPSRLPANDLEKIKELAVAAVKSVGIENGPAHVEIILTKNGPKMVELGARMGGDCITTHLVPLSSGVDMVKATMDIACGDTPDIQPKWQKGAAIRYFHTPCGVIQNIEGVDEARAVEGVKEITFTKQVGDTVGSVDSSVDRIGFVIAQADTAEDAVAVCEKAMQIVTVTMK